MKLTSPSFSDQSPIPQKYTGEGLNISPALKWTDVPPQAKELVLTCDDPDAPTAEPWVHWLIYDISPESTNGLPEGISTDVELIHPFPAKQGRNTFGNIGYGGPFPPVGHGMHRYYFRLYALDKKLKLPPGINKLELLTAIQGNVIAQAEIIGTYERSGREAQIKRAG